MMKKRKIKVLEKVKDSCGITLVMEVSKIKKRRKFSFKRLFKFKRTTTKTKLIVLWTTADRNLVRNLNFEPPKDWLKVNNDFRSFEKDKKTMDYEILDDQELLTLAQKELII
jgi:hypothetical protein